MKSSRDNNNIYSPRKHIFYIVIPKLEAYARVNWIEKTIGPLKKELTKSKVIEYVR
jgi:hypothetical protein